MVNIIKYKDKRSRIKNRYILLCKLMATISVLYLAFLFSGIFSTVLTNEVFNWFFLEINNLIYIGIFLIALFMLIETALYLQYRGKENLYEGGVEPKYINGKKVHVFTYPRDVKGGIFSKTYISIDEDNILLLRDLMRSPEEVLKEK